MDAFKSPVTDPSGRPLLLAGFDDLGVCLHERFLGHGLVGIQTLALLRGINPRAVKGYGGRKRATSMS